MAERKKEMLREEEKLKRELKAKSEQTKRKLAAAEKEQHDVELELKLNQMEKEHLEQKEGLNSNNENENKEKNQNQEDENKINDKKEEKKMEEEKKEEEKEKKKERSEFSLEGAKPPLSIYTRRVMDISKISEYLKPDSSKGQIGGYNLGNTCFMNSSIACLSNCTELTYYFLKGDYKKKMRDKGK